MATQRRTNPRLIRRIVQGVTFALFLLFIVGAGSLAARGLHANWAMRFSPLSGIGASIAAWEILSMFVPALVLLVLAVVLGRYFCGWACPLGTTIDIADKLTGRLRPERDAGEGVPPKSERENNATFRRTKERRLKYYVLAACLLGAFVGLSFFSWMDPLSIAVRSFLMVHSYVAAALGGLFGAFSGSRLVGGLFGSAADALRTLMQYRTVPLFRLHLITMLAFFALLGLGLWRRRFWCRNLCPLGALYALAGKWSLTKRHVSEDCIHCGACVEACPTDCISKDGTATLEGECILCMDCQAACPVDAVRFFGPVPEGQKAEVDVTRRGVAAAAGAAAVAYPLFSLKPRAKETRDSTFIRPPLAGRDEDDFLQKCVRCGQCMRVCPTNVIQPVGLEEGLESMWTPHLVPRLGYCEYECVQCGLACPTEAIPEFTVEEKHKTSVGLAYFDRNRCIPWRGWEMRFDEELDWEAHNCGVCEEVCPVPTKAIRFQHRSGPEGQELRLPYVVEDLCVGCGFCESECPIEGAAAIRVSGGFREIEPPAEPTAAAGTEEALPAKAGDLRIGGPKKSYKGGDELFTYINGGAPPYVEFNFVRVTTANYLTDGNGLKVDLWEFKSPADAFGAYARDKDGEPIDVGDEGSVVSTSLWARTGPFMVSIMPLRGTPTQEQAITLARKIVENLGAEPAPRPDICRQLPEENLDKESVMFVRNYLHIQNLYMSEKIIPEGTLGLSGSAVGAYGAYPIRDDNRKTSVMLVEHPDETSAEDALSSLQSLREEWGDEKVTSAPYPIFRVEQGNVCAMGTSGRRFAAVFFAPSVNVASRLLESALKGGE